MRCGLALCVGRFHPNRFRTRKVYYSPRPRANRRVHQRILCAFCSGAVQKVAHAAISRLRRLNRSERLYAAAVLSLRVWASAISATSAGNLVRSAAQLRKLELPVGLNA